jgi:hypothetical protein
MVFFVRKTIMKHTQEQMQATINTWQESGLSKKEFCRDRNISYATFQYWCKRLEVNVSGFTEVPLSGQQHGSCELIFPSGARLVFHEQPSVAWLRDLVG